MKPAQELLSIFSQAYPCSNFSGICQSMRWNPEDGHIPRGFMGTTQNVRGFPEMGLKD